MMATAGALKRELIIRPRLAFTFMAMTTQSDPNTACAKLAKDTATIVAVFGSASNSASRFREAASETRNPGAAFVCCEPRMPLAPFHSGPQARQACQDFPALSEFRRKRVRNSLPWHLQRTGARIPHALSPDRAYQFLSRRRWPPPPSLR